MPGFLIDLDGTLYRGTERIDCAAEFIQWLQERRMPYLFVTNNSSRTPAQVSGHLRLMGIDAEPAQVMTSGLAAAEYIRRHTGKRQTGRTVYLIGENGLEQALKAAGLNIADQEQPDFVVQGIDRKFTYDKLNLAVRYILSGAQYILTNPDHMLPANGGAIPGAGAIAASIRTASGMEPVIIGKPSPIMINYAVEQLRLPLEDIWVVGDNLDTDICGGHAAGCRTALVLTGVSKADDLKRWMEMKGTAPDLVSANLRELINHFESFV